MDTNNIPPSEARPNLGGMKMRAHRMKLAESQTDFGKKYGVTANTISRYERGERWPDLPLALRFQNDGICACGDWDCDPPPPSNSIPCGIELTCAD